ncbi:MAG: hypothetical protein M3014_07340 [Chloroflexota bacterium]|nr:hypothetical protein [Chloroflexota bacterium]
MERGKTWPLPLCRGAIGTQHYTPSTIKNKAAGDRLVPHSIGIWYATVPICGPHPAFNTYSGNLLGKSATL